MRTPSASAVKASSSANSWERRSPDISRRSFIADLQTLILLDPEGRIVTLGTPANQITEGQLLKLLEQRLPAPSEKKAAAGR